MMRRAQASSCQPASCVNAILTVAHTLKADMLMSYDQERRCAGCDRRQLDGDAVDDERRLGFRSLVFTHGYSTFPPHATLLRAAYFICHCSLLACSHACQTAVSMRADAFRSLFPLLRYLSDYILTGKGLGQLPGGKVATKGSWAAFCAIFNEKIETRSSSSSANSSSSSS